MSSSDCVVPLFRIQSNEVNNSYYSMVHSPGAMGGMPCSMHLGQGLPVVSELGDALDTFYESSRHSEYNDMRQGYVLINRLGMTCSMASPPC